MRRLLVVLALVALAVPAWAGDSPERVQLTWIIDAMNKRAGNVPDAELTAHFADSFIAKVPLTQLSTISKRLAAELAPITITEVTATGPGKLVAKIEGRGQKLRVVLGLEAKTGKMEALLFQPDALAGPRPKTWDEALAALPKLGDKTSLLVASVDGKGRCKALKAVRPKLELAIGSTFKLYLLLALTDQVIAKKLAWDTPVKVDDAWKSLPSGTMQNEPAGKVFPIKDVAGPMIAISDNTATDHVLYTVGRAAAEKALWTARHAKAALNVPFLGTRELFLLKLQTPAPDVAAYIKMPAAKRRAWLDGVGKKALDLTAAMSAQSWIAPRWVDTLEWFASGDDLCNVMATLGARGKQEPTVLELLSRNPGLPVDKATFPYVGYKGGSEPGVLNLTWLLERKDHKWFVVTMGINDTKKAVDDGAATALALGVIELLGKEP